MLTRAKCGLVVVGDIHVAQAVLRPETETKTDDGDGKDRGKGKGKAKGKGKGKAQEPIFTVETASGGTAVVKAVELRKFYRELAEAGRVARVVVEEEKKDKAKGEVPS